jgi:adenine-specific DNA-methyltransferase
LRFHQLWHGDATKLCQKIHDGTIDLVVTDPPFGTDNLSNQSVTPEGKKYARKIANDETPEKAIKIFKEVMDVVLPKMAPKSDMYCFTSYQVLTEWLVMTNEYMPKFGFHRKAIITWAKDGPGMGDTNCPWGMGCEFILFFQKGRRDKEAARRNPVLHVPQVRPAKLIHPHEKPVALLETFIKTSSSPGDFVLDPFAGSGATVRAARNCERNAVGVELDDDNYGLAIRALDEQEESLL